VQVGLSKTSVATDTLPHLATIVAPSLRAVPGQMLTAREQAEQANLVDVMLSYKLAYELTPHALDDLDGNGTACLRPAVDMLLSYPEVRTPSPFPTSRSTCPARLARHRGAGHQGLHTWLRWTLGLTASVVGWRNEVVCS
jgi:hypothetical protein